MRKEPTWPLTARFDQALAMAAQLHTGHYRKGTAIPYIAHLMAVTGLVLENGADEDTAIAALLHDAIEDAGGAQAREEIRRQFGERVTSMVDACTDTDETPKPPWQARKEAYLAHLPHASPEARLISAADKLHNARAILQDYRVLGDDLWSRFNGGKEGTLWYYRELAHTFSRLDHNAIADELARTVAELDRLAGES